MSYHGSPQSQPHADEQAQSEGGEDQPAEVARLDARRTRRTGRARRYGSAHSPAAEGEGPVSQGVDQAPRDLPG